LPGFLRGLLIRCCIVETLEIQFSDLRIFP
jgi:hypothetical protein